MKFLLIFIFSISFLNADASTCSSVLKEANTPIRDAYLNINLLVPQSSALIQLALNSLWISQPEKRPLFQLSLSQTQAQKIADRANAIHKHVSSPGADDYDEDPVSHSFTITPEDINRLYKEFVNDIELYVEKSLELFLQDQDTINKTIPGNKFVEAFLGPKINLFYDFSLDSERVINYFSVLYEIMSSRDFKDLVVNKGWHDIQKRNDRWRGEDTERFELFLMRKISEELGKRFPELKKIAPNAIIPRVTTPTYGRVLVEYFSRIFTFDD